MVITSVYDRCGNHYCFPAGLLNPRSAGVGEGGFMSEPREDEITWCSPVWGEAGSKTPLSPRHRHQWAECRKARQRNRRRETQGAPAERFENRPGIQSHRHVQRGSAVIQYKMKTGTHWGGPSLWHTHPHACIYEPRRESEEMQMPGSSWATGCPKRRASGLSILGLHDFFLPLP